MTSGLALLTDEEKIAFKKRILEACITYLTNRIEAARHAMLEAQESANSEEKSSAGDKYETSRSMGQLQRDMNAKQVEEASRELAFVSALPVTTLNTFAGRGSVVVCDQYVFFIAAGSRTITDGSQQVVMLSPTAPVARQLEGKKAGEKFLFNGREIEILGVF